MEKCRTNPQESHSWGTKQVEGTGRLVGNTMPFKFMKSLGSKSKTTSAFLLNYGHVGGTSKLSVGATRFWVLPRLFETILRCGYSVRTCVPMYICGVLGEGMD